MPHSPNRVVIDRVDWPAVLPVLRLASALRHALQPGKLAVALLAVVVLHGCGLLMDAVWPGDDNQGVYELLVVLERQAAYDLAHHALAMDLGLGSGGGVLNALDRAVIGIPHAVFRDHPGHAIVFGLICLVVIALTSGVLCRMAASQVCAGESMGLVAAVRFVKQRCAWYLLTPVMPVLLVLMLGAVLIVAGLVLFNAAWLDVVGSLLYGPMILLGFVIALVTVLLVFALFLMAPALSVEGTDGFDAISRSFNYVLFRPWQFAGYLLASVGYFAVVFLLVSTLAGLTMDMTYGFVDVGAFAGLDDPPRDGWTRHDYITAGHNDNLTGSTSISAWIVARWIDLLTGVVVAVMFSVVCCLQTRVYVLMRHGADGTPMDEYGKGDEPDPWSTPGDVIEPGVDAGGNAGGAAAADAEPADDNASTEG